MVSVIKLNVLVLNVENCPFMLSVVMLSVVMLSIVAPLIAFLLCIPFLHFFLVFLVLENDSRSTKANGLAQVFNSKLGSFGIQRNKYSTCVQLRLELKAGPSLSTHD